MLITIRAVTPFDSIRRTVLFSYIDRESIRVNIGLVVKIYINIDVFYKPNQTLKYKTEYTNEGQGTKYVLIHNGNFYSL